MAKKQMLGEILIRRGALTPQQLEDALAVRKKEDLLLGEVLVRMGIVHPNGVSEALAEQLGVPFVDLDKQEIEPQAVLLLPESFCRKHLVAPFSVADQFLHVAMVAPDELWAISEIHLLTGYEVRPYLASAGSIRHVLDRCFDRKITTRQTIVDMRLEEFKKQGKVQNPELLADEAADSSDVPIVRLVNSIISGGVSAGASDIHFEPQYPEMRIRYRVDGVLYDNMNIPNHIESPLVSRVKVMADLDVTERRHPQDGHIAFSHEDKPYDLRISTMPTVCGEKIVIRILEKRSDIFQLDHLGFSPRQRTTVDRLIAHPWGMILVTGPTGSGKSTSLYAILNELCRPEVNIITLEDPVENQMKGMNQIGVDPEFGMTFASGLKYILRQDPDIVMVGEIRDGETAEIAVQASLTGHLLLSTLHTNDAARAVTRLVDLGVQPFLIASSLIGVMAQRLVRKVCAECAVPWKPDEEILAEFGPYAEQLRRGELVHGQGCDRCFGTGYRGRAPAVELMACSPAIGQLIERRAGAAEIHDCAVQGGMQTLMEASIEKILSGQTTVEEVRQRILVWESTEESKVA